MLDEKLNYMKYNEAYKSGVSEIGGKAYSIARLSENNIAVPKGVVLPKQFGNILKRQKV